MFKTVTLPMALLSSLCAFAQSTPGSAQVQLATPAQVGKVVVFEVVDSWKGKLLDRCSQRVDAISGDRMTVETNCETRGKRNDTYTVEGNLVSNGRGTYRKHQPLLRFPLEDGKSWDEKVELTTPNGTTHTDNYSVKVIGQEQVQVPAGTFMAWKLEYLVYMARNNWSGDMRETYWYAPEVGAIVLAQYQDSSGTKFQRQVVAFSPANGAAVAGVQESPDCGADLLCHLKKVRPPLGAIVPLINK